jgi:hypothetical protein
MLKKIGTFFERFFSFNPYALDDYIASKNVQTINDAEYWIKEYEKKIGFRL